MTVEEVVKTLHTNAGHARAIAAGILQDVHDLVAEGKELTDIKGSMKFSCVTRADVSVERACTTCAASLTASCNRPSPGRSCLSSCRTSSRTEESGALDA